MTLALKDVNTYYDKSHILQDVSFSIQEKEVVGLLGRNGVGKSTTLKSISGVVTPRSGSILYKGKELRGLKPHQVTKLGIGYVPEERRIFPNLTVQQNLLIGVQSRRARAQEEEAWTLERAYDLFPQLKARQSSKGGNLSGGEQQMLTIVRTLMGNPDLLLLDEPTEGLAPMLVEVVTGVIREIHGSGISILLVEQNFEVILELTSRTYVMSKGRVVFEGTSAQLADNHEVRKQYLEV
ncbi:MAG: ABC transporter ATP-binding protein [Deltaproteobacteria bacterium]|nr:ABC transporter ATP-binding protein [Deltaproteobacteria bacterium]MBW1949458.1 ABC transporter ATP-binding protein [Deltaproteobacteria bacterium]MBW2347339.1 ABC transporter ATP-binding protein [Deltaproteobacteria bacterium]RLB31536.1 MAG: ABC transporter ATP-binding protein [Deltaproteobacteria bacterium]